MKVAYSENFKTLKNETKTDTNHGLAKLNHEKSSITKSDLYIWYNNPHQNTRVDREISQGPHPFMKSQAISDY